MLPLLQRAPTNRRPSLDARKDSNKIISSFRHAKKSLDIVLIQYPKVPDVTRLALITKPSIDCSLSCCFHRKNMCLIVRYAMCVISMNLCISQYDSQVTTEIFGASWLWCFSTWERATLMLVVYYSKMALTEKDKVLYYILYIWGDAWTWWNQKRLYTINIPSTIVFQLLIDSKLHIIYYSS